MPPPFFSLLYKCYVILGRTTNEGRERGATLLEDYTRINGEKLTNTRLNFAVSGELTFEKAIILVFSRIRNVVFDLTYIQRYQVALKIPKDSYRFTR